MHDVESRHRENLRTQSEASMPASSNHFTTLFLAKILHAKTRYDFRFLATIVALKLYIFCILIVPNLSNLVFNVLVVLADRQTVPCISIVLVKPNFHRWYFACRSL